MKTISRGPYALGVCAAAAILAACGGAAQPSLPNGMEQNAARVALNSVAPPSSASEVLTATDVTVSSYCPTTEGASFSASGTATGPYPGTFTASGYWNSGEALEHFFWDFRESIKIMSNTLTIHVHIKRVRGSHRPTRFISCDSFGGVGHPIAMKYKSNYATGIAEIEIIQQGDLSETLDGL
jgi:hypothetical protein